MNAGDFLAQNTMVRSDFWFEDFTLVGSVFSRAFYMRFIGVLYAFYRRFIGMGLGPHLLRCRAGFLRFGRSSRVVVLCCYSTDPARPQFFLHKDLIFWIFIL